MPKLKLSRFTHALGTLTVLVVFGSAGCRAVKTVVDAPGKTIEGVALLGKEKKPTVDPVLVQQELLRLADEFNAQLIAEMGGLKMHATAVAPAQILQWRIDFSTSTCAIVSGANPVANLLDMTAFITLMRMELESFWVPQVFGDSGSPLLARCRTAERGLWQLADTVLSSRHQAEFRRQVEAWFLQNPRPTNVVGLRATGLAALMLAAKNNNFTHVGSLFDQLSLDPLVGLDPATREIALTRLFAERALYVTQKMPQLLRWQLELLNVNALASPVIQQVVANSTQLTVSIDRVSRVVEQLPAQVEKQREALVQALDAQEKQLTPLLGEVRRTLATGRDMSASLNTTFVTFDALMKRFGVGEPVSPAVSGVVKAAGEPFRIQDYATTAAQLEQTAKQLTELLAALNQTVSPVNLERLAEQTRPVVQQAKSGGKDVVDYAFGRGILLVVIGFVALLIYRWLCWRMASLRQGNRR